MSPNPAKPTLAESAYQTMKRAILRAEIPEGTFLDEGEFARRYGIGRTPFREACNRLHQQRLVELNPRRGFRVRGLSVREANDIFEVRLILETASVEFAADRGTAAQISGLEQVVESAARLVNPSAEEIIGANREFHLGIAEMSHNGELVRSLENLLDRYEVLSYTELRNDGLGLFTTDRLHREILQAIRERNVPAARLAVSRDIWESRNLSFPQGLNAYRGAARVELPSAVMAPGKL